MRLCVLRNPHQLMWRLAIRILHPYSRVPAMICSAHLSRLVPSNFQYLRGEADLLAGAFARFMEQKWPAGAWRHRRGDRSFQQLANLRGMNPIAGAPGEPPHAFEQGYLQKFPVHLNMALTNPRLRPRLS